MASPRFRHRVEFTRNKHSRAIAQGNTIVIRLARNLSRTEQHEHIQNLLRRMTQLILEERRKQVIDPFRPILNGAQTLTVRTATGKRYVFSLVPGRRTEARATARGWKVFVGPTLRRRALHRFLWSLLAASERERLTNLVHALNERTFGVTVREVKVAFASTQWGSCSPRGIIMLNASLLLLPRSVLHYVIVHELAHRRVANHSPAYWREVQRAMPHYMRPYRLLQEYRLPQL